MHGVAEGPLGPARPGRPDEVVGELAGDGAEVGGVQGLDGVADGAVEAPPAGGRNVQVERVAHQGVGEAVAARARCDTILVTIAGSRASRRSSSSSPTARPRTSRSNSRPIAAATRRRPCESSGRRRTRWRTTSPTAAGISVNASPGRTRRSLSSSRTSSVTKNGFPSARRNSSGARASACSSGTPVVSLTSSATSGSVRPASTIRSALGCGRGRRGWRRAARRCRLRCP